MAVERVQDKIPLISPEGQKMLGEASAKQTLLLRLFKEQENNTFCGIHSSALVMSAKHLGQQFADPSEHLKCPVDDVPYTESNLFTFKETKAALDYASCDTNGATMDEIYNLLCAHGLTIKKVHVDESSVKEFRTLASEALSQVGSEKGVIVNYDEYDLGQDEHVHGHFSVLAAYHETTDRFLLLDTWFNTVDCWVNAGDLFRCMNTFDKDANKYRGFMIVG
ncbi:glutathione gamma-glutamylcysteinyltransferase 3-like [Lytechinus variegatus]|nr:glutathione gamma-glutamylcysteinyltransferase 3-like [Lytechinus variegatus]